MKILSSKLFDSKIQSYNTTAKEKLKAKSKGGTSYGND